MYTCGYESAEPCSGKMKRFHRYAISCLCASAAWTIGRYMSRDIGGYISADTPSDRSADLYSDIYADMSADTSAHISADVSAGILWYTRGAFWPPVNDTELYMYNMY